VLVAGLWWGPGGGRLRSPVNRVVAPLSRRVRTWLLALAVAVLVAGLCWGLALRGADWMPFDGPPFSALGD
jgi:CHASE2 domain-containing sensor protein